jgi:hypothetical protein
LKEKKLTYVLLERMSDVDTIDELKVLKKNLKKDDAPKTYEFIKSIGV